MRKELNINLLDGVTSFKWDTQNIGTGIDISEDNARAFLKEGPYMFRTVLGDQVIIIFKEGKN